MKRVLTAVLLIPIVLLVVFRAPIWLFTAFVGAVALLAVREYLGIVAGYSLKPFRALAMALAVLLFGETVFFSAGFGQGLETFFPFPLDIGVISAFLFLALGMRRPDLREGALAAVMSYLSYPYIALALFSLVALRSLGWIFVLFVLVVVWVGDTCAYYVGRTVGKRLLAPRISPKKTWEGTIASLFGSMIAGALVILYAPAIAFALGRVSLLAGPDLRTIQLPVVVAAAIAAVVNLAGQAGDLVESLLKRGAKMKDSGSLLPGHGGILDRIDALLFAAPVADFLFHAAFRHFFSGVR